MLDLTQSFISAFILILIFREIHNKRVSKMNIDKRGGAVKTMCNTPPPFQGQHLRRDVVEP